MKELEHKQQKVTVYSDSHNALHIARNLAFHSRAKHIGVQYHYVREIVDKGNAYMKKIQTTNKLVDVMTKAINTDKF